MCPNHAVSKGGISVGFTERMTPHVTVLDDFRSKLSWWNLLLALPLYSTGFGAISNGHRIQVKKSFRAGG